MYRLSLMNGLEPMTESIRRAQQVAESLTLGYTFATVEAIRSLKDSLGFDRTILDTPFAEFTQMLQGRNHLAETIAMTFQPLIKQRQWLEQFSQEQFKVLSSLVNLPSPLPESLVVGSDGSLSLGNETIRRQDVTEKLGELAADLESASSPSSFFEVLRSYLTRAKGPFVFLIVHVIIPYVLFIGAELSLPIYQRWLSDDTRSTRGQLASRIRRNMVADYSSEQLREHRFVMSQTLRVRAERRTTDKFIDALSFGQIVRVLAVEELWSLVEYVDFDSGTIRQGWVFSRHLAGFAEQLEPDRMDGEQK